MEGRLPFENLIVRVLHHRVQIRSVSLTRLSSLRIKDIISILLPLSIMLGVEGLVRRLFWTELMGTFAEVTQGMVFLNVCPEMLVKHPCLFKRHVLGPHYAK